MPSSSELHPATVRLLRALAEGGPSIRAEATVARLTWMEAGYPDLPRPAGRERFGTLLATKRLAAGMSQRALATALLGVRGAHVTAVAHWESGESLPDAGQLAALFSILSWSEGQRAEALRLAYEYSLLLPGPRE